MSKSFIRRSLQLTAILGQWVSLRRSKIEGRYYMECFDVRNGKTLARAESSNKARCTRRLFSACKALAFSYAQASLNTAA